MRPMTLVAAGLAVVAIDLRSDHVDLLADPVGWLLVAEACRRLLLRAPMWAAVAAAVLSTSEVWLAHHHAITDPVTGRIVATTTRSLGAHVALVFDDVHGAQLAAMALAHVAGAVALWLLVTELADRAGADGRRLRLVRWAPLLWAVPFVVLAVAQHGGYDPVWNGTAKEYLWLLGVLALLGVAAQAILVTGRRWALPPAEPLRTL